jgi:hypothetical protein
MKSETKTKKKKKGFCDRLMVRCFIASQVEANFGLAGMAATPVK